MGKKPWFQFYTGDWMKDPALSMCSPATRGIWMDILCAMHEFNREGEIVGSIEQIARLCRCSVLEMEAAIKELHETECAIVGICNKKNQNCNAIVTITNKRMRREHVEREKGRKRVRRHRCNADVTEMKQESNNTCSYVICSSLHSEHIKKAAAAATKRDAAAAAFSDNFFSEDQNTGNTERNTVPKEVEGLISRLVELRSKAGIKIKVPSVLRGFLRAAWVNDPTEAERWKVECGDLELEIERAEKQKNEAKRVADKHVADIEEAEERQKRTASILREYGDFSEQDKLAIMEEVKNRSDEKIDPSRPMLYVPLISEIMKEWRMGSFGKDNG